MRTIKLGGTALALVASLQMAHATTIDRVSGGVLVNHGAGFVAISGAQELQPGDLVMVKPDGTAAIVYPDGCTVSVKKGAIATISAKSPCTLRQARKPAGSMVQTAAEGDVVNAEEPMPDEPPVGDGVEVDPAAAEAAAAEAAAAEAAGSGTGGLSAGTIAIGAVAVGAAVGIGVLVANKNKSSSP